MFIYENIGNKKRQEDFYFTFIKDYIEFYFVLDGHGFEKNKIFIIDFLKKNNFFEKTIYFFFNKYPLNKNNIEKFFLHLDNILKQEKINSGACLTGLIIDNINNIFYLLNLGDTKFFIFKNKKKVYESIEHNLKNVKEKERILAFNKIKFVKYGRYKNIIMTRVLGDTDCKNEKPNPIIPIPEISMFNIDDLIIILTTDGIKFNYNIDYIVNNYNDHEKLKKYCDYVNSENLKKNKPIDNILFMIILLKKKNIIKEEEKKKIKEIIKNKELPKNSFKYHDKFIYNCLKNLFL